MELPEALKVGLQRPSWDTPIGPQYGTLFSCWRCLRSQVPVSDMTCFACRRELMDNGN